MPQPLGREGKQSHTIIPSSTCPNACSKATYQCPLGFRARPCRRLICIFQPFHGHQGRTKLPFSRREHILCSPGLSVLTRVPVPPRSTPQLPWNACPPPSWPTPGPPLDAGPLATAVSVPLPRPGSREKAPRPVQSSSSQHNLQFVIPMLVWAMWAPGTKAHCLIANQFSCFELSFS